MKASKPTLNMLKAMSAAMLLATATACGGHASDRQTATTDSSAQQTANPGGPQLGSAGGGQVIDKSADATLQAMIKDVAPQFAQLDYKDAATGKTMRYNLYTPKGAEKGAKLPLVMFIADASTPGESYAAPLTQGYGGLIWATKEWQAKNPCYVLVPQFTGVAVNDAYERTDEVDIAVRLLNSVVENNNVDANRLYATGQSMGGMISMYYNVAYPELFAASIFVDSHWDTASFAELAKHKFVYFIAGDKGKAYADMKPLEEACEKDGVQYTYAQWSAKLPEKRQSELAATMLAKGAPVNIFQFEPGSVLPADGKDSEHMYSFDYAYKITAVRDWLFKQKK
ncbi:MAG: alpha/beta hydrolase-fold protein [Candidatus Amulumruptor caecigallinarius]|nr:alpha/beta hydrolase-fold protein [Candidatus Amulumruptor caecigallinarius]MCM1397732.1 alpha/beta hydrolase-fold protein [Candidatus Amulumruptor caecigallinarius]MCM1454618.1 alpha/beta hydrolase-fold protein [bacterium]